MSIRVLFCYLGMSTMLPWNFLLSITSFWDYKFRNVTLDPIIAEVVKQGGDLDLDVTPTQMQMTFPSYLAIASHVPGAMTTLVHSFFGQRVE